MAFVMCLSCVCHGVCHGVFHVFGMAFVMCLSCAMCLECLSCVYHGVCRHSICHDVCYICLPYILALPKAQGFAQG